MPRRNSAGVWKNRAFSHAHARLAICPSHRFIFTVSANVPLFWAWYAIPQYCESSGCGAVYSGLKMAYIISPSSNGCSNIMAAAISIVRLLHRANSGRTNPVTAYSTSTSAVKNIALSCPQRKSSSSRHMNLRRKSFPRSA